MNEINKIYYEATDWCEELSLTKPRPIVIEAIENRLQVATNKLEIIALKEHLVRLYQLTQDYPKARSELEDIVKFESGSEMAYASLASHYLYFEDDPQSALNSIAAAEIAAAASGHFRRHIQAQKARIALALNDYELFSGALIEITEISILNGQRDVKKERDFFDRADKKKLDPKLVEAFELYLKSKPDASERPA